MVRKHSYSTRWVPDDPDNLVDWLDQQAGIRYMIEPGRVFAEYSRRAMARDPGLRDQLRDQLGVQPREVQAAVAGRARPGNALEALYRADAPGAKLDGEFAGLGDLVAALRHGDKRLDRVRNVQNSFGSEVPADGGFLIPEEVRGDLVLASIQAAIVRPRAINIPMGTLRVGVPALDATSDVSSILGGFIAYWTEEGAAIAQSTPSYMRVFLDAKKLAALGTAPNELMTDAPAFDTYLRTVLPQAMAWWEDQALTAGDGVGQPLGYLNARCAIEVTRAASGHVKHADIIAMVTRMLPASLPRAVWQCSPDVLTELLNIFVNFGSATTGVASPPGWLEFDGTMWRLLGLPLFVTEHVPALGTTGDLSLADLGMYLLGTRALMQMDVSPHVQFSLDVSQIRVKSRVDGRMWPTGALTPRNGSQTVSPVVILN